MPMADVELRVCGLVETVAAEFLIWTTSRHAARFPAHVRPLPDHNSAPFPFQFRRRRHIQINIKRGPSFNFYFSFV